MRNGNFIEFTVDNENQDESCSIISSANVQHPQLIGDYSFPSLTSTATNTNSQLSGCSSLHTESPSTTHNSHQKQYSSTSSELTANSSHVPSNSQEQVRYPHQHNHQHHHPQRPRPASIVSDVVSSHHPITIHPASSVNAQYSWLQVSSSNSSNYNCSPATSTTMATVTSNASSAFCSSPSLPKRNKQMSSSAIATSTTTATTTSSSISSVSSGIQMSAPWHSNTNSDHSSGSNLRLLANHSAVHIYWPVRNFTEISIGPSTTAFDVITHFVTSQLYAKVPTTPTSSQPVCSTPSRYVHSFAIRLICRSLNPNDHQWLHPTQNVQQFIDLNRGLLEKGWTLELRIRYLPPSLQQLFDDDFVIFKFLYEQVLEEFLMLDLPANCMLSYQDLIVELGCLELRRINPFLTPQGLEKSSNFEALEAEIHKFLPASFIASVKVTLKLCLLYLIITMTLLSCMIPVKAFTQTDQKQV